MMLKDIDSNEARTRLSELLRRIEAGESFTITVNGRPVADLIPSRSSYTAKTEAAIANILKARKHPVSDSDLTDMKRTGRR